MKLNKKRISILVSLMCLLVLLVFTLCSFDLPDYPYNYSEMLVTNGISSQDLSNILSIFQYQDLAGQFNSLIPLCIFLNAQNRVLALFAVPSSTLSITSSYYDNAWYYSFKNITNTNLTFILIGLSDQGFSVYSTSYTGEYRVLRSNALYYRPSYDASFTLNPHFTTNSSVTNSDILSVYNYWNYYISRLSSSGSGASSEELESAYIDGYGDGYFDGKDVGYGLGFESGYIEGVTDGFNTGYMEGNQDGFDIGFSEGYDTGYSYGYQDGYETGYDSGYSEAERETVIEYVEAVELDIPHIFNSIGAVPRQVLHGVDFEIFGVPILGVLLSILVLTISIFVIRKIK